MFSIYYYQAHNFIDMLISPCPKRKKMMLKIVENSIYFFKIPPYFLVLEKNENALRFHFIYLGKKYKLSSTSSSSSSAIHNNSNIKNNKKTIKENRKKNLFKKKEFVWCTNTGKNSIFLTSCHQKIKWIEK